MSSEPNSTSPLFGTYIDLLYNTGGANYSDDIHLGYDVCAIFLWPDNLYDNTILRGQSDNGSCYQTFDDNCANALMNAAQGYATWIDHASPLPNSNLTAESLPTVCSDIRDQMAAKLPDECQAFINTTGPTNYVATDYFCTQCSPCCALY